MFGLDFAVRKLDLGFILLELGLHGLWLDLVWFDGLLVNVGCILSLTCLVFDLTWVTFTWLQKTLAWHLTTWPLLDLWRLMKTYEDISFYDCYKFALVRNISPNRLCICISYFSGNSSLFSIFLIIIGLIFNLCAKSSIDRPFSNLASLMEGEFFKKTIYVI